MKTLILVAAAITIALAMANAASANDCPQILETLKASASAITQNANSYWQHRANFINHKYGQAHVTVPDALTVAGQEESHGNALRKAMPNGLANFKSIATQAQSLSCLSPVQLSAIVEPTIKHAKRVKIDKFPKDEGFHEGISKEPSVNPRLPKLPRMPSN